MHQEQRQRTLELLRTRGIERALFAHLDSVKWLTGFAPSPELGFSQYMGGPFVVWVEGGHFTLITLDQYAHEAARFAADADATLETYLGYTIDAPLAPADHLAAALRRVVASSRGAGKIGVELNGLPARLLQTLQTALGVQAEIVPLDHALVPLRLVKTAAEMAALRRAFALTDTGQRAAQQATQVGMTEMDVWMAAQTAINRAAGCRIPLGNDTVVGYRSPNNIGGWPLDYVIHAETALIVDLGLCYQGYWSDSCATYYPVAMTPRQAVLHRYVQDALDYAISLIRPGVRARDVDAQVRAFMARGGYPVYPHHTGHGVGVSAHEEPRIVPYNDMILQAGMVILLEPGIYYPGETSVRLEDALLITPDGVEVLTGHLRQQ